MEAEWVEFRIIKAAVTMQMVLDHYGVSLKQSGHELRGKCPIHRDRTINISLPTSARMFLNASSRTAVRMATSSTLWPRWSDAPSGTQP